MNATGRKMTISETEVAIDRERHLLRPVDRRLERRRPSSSMCRKMFSSTTIASSMTMPTASVSAEQRHAVQREVQRAHQREAWR